MLNRTFLPVLFITLAACGGGPTGDWTGTVAFETADGATYFNKLSVGDEDATAELFSLYANPGFDGSPGQAEYLLAAALMVGTWESKGKESTFELSCDLDGCDFEITLTCELEDKENLKCDSSPDYYEDDADRSPAHTANSENCHIHPSHICAKKCFHAVDFAGPIPYLPRSCSIIRVLEGIL